MIKLKLIQAFPNINPNYFTDEEIDKYNINPSISVLMYKCMNDMFAKKISTVIINKDEKNEPIIKKEDIVNEEDDNEEVFSFDSIFNVKDSDSSSDSDE